MSINSYLPVQLSRKKLYHTWVWANFLDCRRGLVFNNGVDKVKAVNYIEYTAINPAWFMDINIERNKER